MRAAPLPLCFVVCMLSAVHLCSAQTDFDIRNKEGLSRNPAGLTLLLKAEAERQTFHLFETIPIELEFSSSSPSTYSIELDEAMNFAGWTHRFQVEPENSVLLTELEWSSHGVVCCDSNRRYLSQQPTVFKRDLTDYLRFEKAGTYRLFSPRGAYSRGPANIWILRRARCFLPRTFSPLRFCRTTPSGTRNASPKRSARCMTRTFEPTTALWNRRSTRLSLKLPDTSRLQIGSIRPSSRRLRRP